VGYRQPLDREGCQLDATTAATSDRSVLRSGGWVVALFRDSNPLRSSPRRWRRKGKDMRPPLALLARDVLNGLDRNLERFGDTGELDAGRRAHSANPGANGHDVESDLACQEPRGPTTLL
jgi:hypothetical protein